MTQSEQERLSQFGYSEPDVFWTRFYRANNVTQIALGFFQHSEQWEENHRLAGKHQELH